MHNEVQSLCDDAMLRAPTRKRKSPEASVQPRIIRMLWDVDYDSTDTMMKDVGVSLLMPDGKKTNGRHSVKSQSNATQPAQSHAVKPKDVPAAMAKSLSTSQTPRDGATGITLSPLLSCIELEQDLSNFRDAWSLMPDEIFLSVFAFLPKPTLCRCARVCRRWRRLAYDESLWKGALDLKGKTLKKSVIFQLLERGVSVVRLARVEIKSPADGPNLPLSLHTCVNRLQYLDLSMAIVSVQTLEELLSSCVHLLRLSLESCQLSNNICRYIGRNQQMEVLNLCMCQGITENALVPLCNSLHSLDSLNIAWTSMNRDAVVYLVTSLPPTLTRLNFSGYRNILQDEDVVQLCLNCPRLTELDLSDAAAITSQSVECIIAHLTSLRYLALSRCYRIALPGLMLLAEIQSLEALDVFGMLKESTVNSLAEVLSDRKPHFRLNKCPYSSIARPTTGSDRSKVWGIRVTC